MQAPELTTSGRRHRVVVVGGGFAGLQAALHLARGPVELTLVDRRNFHLFQPLAYQVATGSLSPGEITYPLRAIFHSHPNVRVLMAELTDFAVEEREVTVRTPGDSRRIQLGYDTLIVAGGSHYSYFGHPQWARHAPELKSLEGALEIRGRILDALERAETEPDPGEREALLTFVVVGAGPTGVEMAGQIAEIARDTGRDFRNADTSVARVLLIEGLDRVLHGFPPSLSRAAHHELEALGVTPVLNHMVSDIDETSVTVRAGDDTEKIGSRTVIWAAGVTASSLASQLAHVTAADVDRAGRLLVQPDLTVPGHSEILAIGDMVQVQGADPLPGLAPVAMQQGRYAARLVRNRLRGDATGPFHYRDKGNLATIGRAKGVADLHVVRLSGFVAWVTWLVVHLWYLIGFQNRLLVLFRWSISFLTHGRGSRLITSGGDRSVEVSHSSKAT